MKLKFCRKCGSHKPLDHFWRAQQYCIACGHAYSRQRSAKNKAKQYIVSNKFCTRCRVTRSAEEFGRNSCREDGLAVWCRTCTKAYHKEYYTRNKADITARTTARNHNKRSQESNINHYVAGDWEEIKAEYAGCCAYCGIQMDALTQDHVVPLSEGGSVSPRNIVPACDFCNKSKGNRPLLVWMFTVKREPPCVSPSSI